MQMEVEDADGDADEEEIEYPPELDEYLEFCVHERNGDFELISQDFLEIAAELEEPLADRANEFFSAEALRRRWKELNGEGEEQEIEANATGPQLPFNTSAYVAPAAASAASSTDSRASPLRGGDAMPAVEESPPSGFNIFQDNLKEKIDQIYLDVQSRLPSSLGALEADDGSEEDEEGIAGTGSGALAPSTATLSPAVTGAASDDTAGEKATVAADAGGAGSPEDDTGLRQRTIELFGTDDLGEILAGAAAEPTSTPGNVSNEVASFDAVLLSHGVNPQNIEGPNVELPEEVRGIFSEMRKGLEASGAVPQKASEPSPTMPLPKDVAAPARSDGTSLVTSSAAMANPKAAAGNAKRHVSGAMPEDRSTEEERANGSGSGESGDEDFALMRQKLKTNSMQLVGTNEESGSVRRRPPAPAKFTPPPRAAPAANQQRTQPSQSQKFVKLELVESSDEGTDSATAADQDEEDEDDETEEDEQEASGDEGPKPPKPWGMGQDGEPIRVMSRLLRRAPTGECAWDTWLEATRRFPRLQTTLGPPEFFRRGGHDLRVALDVGKLKALLEEERQKRAERKRLYEERRERFKNGVAEFVREAERRREMLGGRLGESFVLNSRSPELEHLHGKNRLQKIAEREAAEKRQREAAAEVERQQREAQERKERELKREEERERKQRDEQERRNKLAEQERARIRAEEEAQRRKERLHALQEEVASHRCPLYDTNISHAAELSGLSPRARRLLDESSTARGADGLCAYVMSWGAASSVATSSFHYACATATQREALGLLHERNIAEAALLVSGAELRNLAPEQGAHTLAIVVILMANVCAGILDTRLPCGTLLREVLRGPLPLEPTVTLLQRPMALWAGDLDTSGASNSQQLSPVNTETVCIGLAWRAIGIKDGAVRALLEEAQAEGLAPVGVRLVFPPVTASEVVSSAALRNALKVGGPILTLAIRGPNALGIWRRLLGPADPQLARSTDPTSLNARFGGNSRGEALALNPPSAGPKALKDIIWAFGGRVDDDGPDSPALPSKPVHSIHIGDTRSYCLRISGPLTFAGAGEVLAGALLRSGRVLDFTIGGDASDGIVLHAVREGGGDYTTTCSCLLNGPPAEEGSPSSPNGNCKSNINLQASEAAGSLIVQTCEASAGAGDIQPPAPPRPSGAATTPVGGASPEELRRMGEPEVLILGFRPRVVAAPATFRRAVEGLFAKFGALGGPGGTAMPASLGVGAAADLLAFRVLDLSGASSSSGCAKEDAIHVLRGFRSFAHVVRRAPDEDLDAWWQEQATASAAGHDGQIAFLCLRGEDLIGRFRLFLSREWQLPAATAGDILFAPTRDVALRTWRAFFGTVRGPSPFLPTWPRSDLRSNLRFSRSIQLDESTLFPERLKPEFTVAVLFSTCADTLLHRVLAAADQHGFALAAVVVAGRVREELAERLFAQEIADGQLTSDSWEEFKTSLGCRSGEGDALEESEFRLVWVILSRHQAVRRLAQLCGDGDPAVNQHHFNACLRQGKGRIQNGIRCATSVESSEALLDLLEPALAPWLRPQLQAGAQDDLQGGRSLGVEASGVRSMECALFVAVLVEGVEWSLAQLLKELQASCQQKGLSLVGLRALTLPSAASAVSPGTGKKPSAVSLNASSAAWPAVSQGDVAAQLEKWLGQRPSASGLRDLFASVSAPSADAGIGLVVAACEGPAAIAVTKEFANGVAAKGVGMQREVAQLACYASNASDAPIDVPYFFHELFGGYHYIVDEDT